MTHDSHCSHLVLCCVVQVQEALDACRTALLSLVSNRNMVSVATLDVMKSAVRMQLTESLKHPSYWVHLTSTLPSLKTLHRLPSDLFTALEAVTVQVTPSLKNSKYICVSLMASSSAQDMQMLLGRMNFHHNMLSCVGISGRIATKK